MKGVFELISDFDMFSRNSVQGLAMTVLLNKKVEDLNIIYNLLKEFENRDIKISHQFLSIIGIISRRWCPKICGQSRNGYRLFM